MPGLTKTASLDGLNCELRILVQLRAVDPQHRTALDSVHDSLESRPVRNIGQTSPKAVPLLRTGLLSRES